MGQVEESIDMASKSFATAEHLPALPVSSVGKTLLESRDDQGGVIGGSLPKSSEPSIAEAEVGKSLPESRDQCAIGQSLPKSTVPRIAEVEWAVTQAMRGVNRSDAVLRWQWSAAAARLDKVLKERSAASGVKKV